ncbi:MAG: hypothetical protein LBV74_03085 [Tannerella sp.]|jgi:hypothetical protein|nr:hypothetical protein [Tannerella sp.]
MKKFRFKKFVLFMVTLSTVTLFTKAQKVEISAGADIVSSYIWRGQNLGGVSIQPTAAISVGGFSLATWGSVGFDNSDTKEFDFTLSYGVRGFNAAITDYWFDTPDKNGDINNYFDYAAHTTAHMFEATLGYDFGPVAINWNTYFAGADYKTDGDRAYSTYIEAGAPFRAGGFDLKAELGITPWEGIYSDRFNVVNMGMKVGKDIHITESFSVPVFTKITFNPYQEKCYFVFGITL